MNSDAPSGAREHRGYWRPGLIALGFLVLVALLINFLGLSSRSIHELAGRDIETRIGQTLQFQQRLGQPPEVTCPTSEPARAGVTFACTVHGAGGDYRVQVVEVDNHGAFRFSPAPGRGN
ncbi:MAG: DUF4333 domain-containing protein [Acidimicrobiales bacterium]